MIPSLSRTLRSFAPAVLTAAAFATGVRADTVTFHFEMSPLAVVPPLFSGAVGSADVELDTVTGELTVTGTYTNLDGVPTQANLRSAAASANGPVVLDLSASGSPSGTLGGSGVLAADEVQSMLLGETYLLIGTSSNPLGELRGQVRLPSVIAPYDGASLNPPDSLSFLSGAAAIGGTLHLGIDNTLGTQAAPAIAFLAYSVSSASIFLPGAGMSAPGAVGEVLIFPAKYPFPFKGWLGPMSPADFKLSIPLDTSLVGATIYLQGGLYEPLADHLGLTNGVQLTIGNL